MVAMSVVLVFKVGIARLSFEYPWLIITTNWLPFVASDKGPKNSMEINFSWPLAEKRLTCRVHVLFPPFRAYSQQSFTVV